MGQTSRFCATRGLAPCASRRLFGHGLSLMFLVPSDEEVARFEVMADLPVQSFVGSHSTWRNNGRLACCGSSVTIMDDELRAACTSLLLSWDDFARIASDATADPSQAAAILTRSRQNVNALVKRGTLHPIKTGPKSTLFLCSDVLDRP